MNSDDLLSPPPKSGGGAREGALRYSVAHFLIALVLLMVTAPFVQPLEYAELIEDVLFTVAMLSAVLAVGGGRRTLVVAILLVVPVVIGQWGPGSLLVPLDRGEGTIPALVFLLFVLFHLLRFILRAPQVNSEVLCAGIASYLMLGLVWAVAYVLVHRLAPGSFAYTPGGTAPREMVGFDALYYSFITLSTVGYGDFVPLSPAARMLAMTEAVTGTLYLAILISRLVSLHASAASVTKRD